MMGKPLALLSMKDVRTLSIIIYLILTSSYLSIFDSENNIYDGKAAGIAINEGGHKFIFYDLRLLIHLFLTVKTTSTMEKPRVLQSTKVSEVYLS